MKLKNITTTACPVCGCTEIVREAIMHTVGCNFEPRIQVHANGGVWESREFLCGKSVSYSPNYCREELMGTCFYDPEVIKMKEKRKADKEKLLKFCAENDIEDSVIRQLRFE